MNSDGTALAQLTTASGINFEPSWSPDGNQIVFVSDRDGDLEIYTMATDGSNQTAITNNNRSDYEPKWALSNTSIVYLSDGQIHAVNVDGTNDVALTSDDMDKAQPSWSPDGNQIVYTSLFDGSTEIFVMDADGTDPTQLTNSSNITYYNSPAWSPNGEIIAFRGPSEDFYRVNPDGSGFARITNEINDTGSFVWLSDSSGIIFASTAEGLIQVNIDGSNRTPLGIQWVLTEANSFSAPIGWQPTLRSNSDERSIGVTPSRCAG